MRQPTVIVICGFARVGKDTLGQALLDLLPHSRKVAFADSLKAAGNLFLERLNLHGLADLNRESDKFRFRDFLVAGGKMARALDPEVFAERAAYEANLALLAGRSVVITDWRYANELVAVQTKCAPHKVVTVRLHRESTGPANEEEAIHMAQIEDTCRIDHEASFKSGETAAIRDLAFLIASQIPEVPGA
jgi:hypothetical protein